MNCPLFNFHFNYIIHFFPFQSNYFITLPLINKGLENFLKRDFITTFIKEVLIDKPSDLKYNFV